MSFFKMWKERRAKKDAEILRKQVEERLATLAKTKGDFEIDQTIGEATGTFKDLRQAVESVTTSKRETRASVRRILDLLPGRKGEK